MGKLLSQKENYFESKLDISCRIRKKKVKNAFCKLIKKVVGVTKDHSSLNCCAKRKYLYSAVVG